ncbi:hypothetical protein [uncultured Streptomyces sp.]|uniref:hypothetical protein n=1 Tax=uncultured Streptomyces sp. TaxID=174707 RepID=UPI00260218DE|nr:hypothetical protein [uncultured Streptomyces sp.]
MSAATPAPCSPEQAAFAALLATYARDCPPADGTPLVPAGEKPTGPVPTLSLAPGETPPADPIEPGPVTGPAAELSARDWCTGGHHEQRTIEALLKVPDPTPAKVRETLNRLGYTDNHIHGLKQDGATTRFHLDLRENGGQLCLTGAAAGETTDATLCVAPATGPFTVITEEQP